MRRHPLCVQGCRDLIIVGVTTFAGIRFSDPLACWELHQIVGLVNQCRKSVPAPFLADFEARLRVYLADIEAAATAAEIAAVATPLNRDRYFTALADLSMGWVRIYDAYVFYTCGPEELARVRAFSDESFGHWLDSREAAARIGRSRRHVQRLARTHQIEARMHPDGTWRFDSTSLAIYQWRSRRNQ